MQEKRLMHDFNRAAVVFVFILCLVSLAGCLEKESPPQIFYRNIFTPMGCFRISSSMEIFPFEGGTRPATHNCFAGFDERNRSFAITASVIDLAELNVSVALPDGGEAYARNLRAGKCGGFFGLCGRLCLEGDHKGFHAVSVNYPDKKLMFQENIDWDKESYEMENYQLEGGETEIIIIGKMKQKGNKTNNCV